MGFFLPSDEIWKFGNFTSPNRIQAIAPKRKTHRLLTTGLPPSSIMLDEPLVQVHSNSSTFWKLLKPRMRSTCQEALVVALYGRFLKISHFSQCMPANCQQSPLNHTSHRLKGRLLLRKYISEAKSLNENRSKNQAVELCSRTTYNQVHTQYQRQPQEYGVEQMFLVLIQDTFFLK